MLVEERYAPLPGVLRRLLLVDLRAVVREERVRRPRVEDELRRDSPLPELRLEPPHVVRRDTRVPLAVETQHRRLDPVREAEGVHAGGVGIGALDVTVPRRRPRD